MSQSYYTINAEPVQYTLFTRVFGATDSPELKKKLEDSWKDLLEPIERLFLNDAAAAAAIERGGTPQKVASFVTFSDNTERMKRWELSADIRIVTPDLPGKPGEVEANLQSLARDFGACFAIPLLYGQDFLDRYPQLLDDFWKFDNDMFPLLMIGIPSWAPFKIMKEGLAARSRLLDEMEALYRRIDQAQRGKPVDADMSGVSSAAFERNNVYEREKWSFRQRAGGDLAIFWGQNANTHPVLFWLLVYVYSTPGLLEELREEIAPYIILSQTEPPEITSMDLPALSHNCQLLKACIFETYRMANEATSIRYIARPVTVNDGANKHELKPGMFVSAPHSLIQRDPSVYANPDKFVPDRFLEVDPESGKLIARYGRLKPWGSGAAMCKGRTFAEKEIVALSAAIMTLWNIGPASGTWKLPAMVPGTGVKKPVEDIRVTITRRTF
jgi:cytochrome P450